MKLSSVTILVALSALFAGCSSLDNPFAGWFHSHGDARVYNPQTGEWEWPNEKATPKPQKAANVAGALKSTPAPQSDGRYFDPQKNEWVEVRATPAPHSAKPTPAPVAPGEGVAVAAAPTPPPPPRPARATGIYNSATGRIEWQASSETAPHGTPEPASTTHWWWPFSSEAKPHPTPTPAAPANPPVKHWWWPC